MVELQTGPNVLPSEVCQSKYTKPVQLNDIHGTIKITCMCNALQDFVTRHKLCQQNWIILSPPVGSYYFSHNNMGVSPTVCVNCDHRSFGLGNGMRQ